MKLFGNNDLHKESGIILDDLRVKTLTLNCAYLYSYILDSLL